ncbi:hypothetical protein, partial [Pseudomonas piscis]|uniref:hypothetical protein n=1 Tax=Pseudomonas piscis TaxID=2614538 RepID=UPI001F3D2619
LSTTRTLKRLHLCLANLCFTTEPGGLLTTTFTRSEKKPDFGRIVLQNRSKSTIAAYSAGAEMLVVFAR